MAGLPESLEDILLDADAEGFQVTIHQLERWRQAGLMPRSLGSEGLGRGLGTMSYYPAGTAEQVIEIAIGLEEKHRLAHAGWRLWMLGYDVSGFVRTELQKAARPKRHRPFGRRVRQVFRQHLDHSPTRLVEVLEEVVDGEFVTESLSAEKDLRWISRFLGSHRSDDEKLLLAGEMLRAVSDATGRAQLEEVLETIRDDQLRQAQVELLAMARSFSPELGSWALGWAPVRLFPQWVALRWGASILGEQARAFLANPSWLESWHELIGRQAE